uniref:Uncharacterized protein n=1 Tax=Triticum urartu TaxID=4572 RepID=A0A8R7R963_TRIUA
LLARSNVEEAAVREPGGGGAEECGVAEEEEEDAGPGGQEAAGDLGARPDEARGAAGVASEDGHEERGHEPGHGAEVARDGAGVAVVGDAVARGDGEDAAGGVEEPLDDDVDEESGLYEEEGRPVRDETAEAAASVGGGEGVREEGAGHGDVGEQGESEHGHLAGQDGEARGTGSGDAEGLAADAGKPKSAESDELWVPLHGQ